jgi:spore maturation protein CgeB
MRIVLFCHSILSDWNHGNAHFLRGIASELQRRGHELRIFEPESGWSLTNLLADAGETCLAPFREAYPDLRSTFYEPAHLDLDAALDGAQLVIVHEWSDPLLIERLASHRRHGGRYRLLFHDTHHRSITDPAAMARYALDGFDGVLAFGEAVRAIYLARGWARRVWTWHEAADVTRFRPLEAERMGDLVWIGNWGDGERSRELHEFLLEPVSALRLAATVHGVRYPAEGREALAKAGIVYGGYLPNPLAPAAFAYHRVTVHVPRRPYAEALPGIPTIRVFEALACGIPLISTPWDDCEGLFSPGKDFLVARDGAEMRRHLRFLLNEPQAAATLAARGRRTVLARHTCGDRVGQLLEICRSLGIGEADAEESRVCVSG